MPKPLDPTTTDPKKYEIAVKQRERRRAKIEAGICPICDEPIRPVGYSACGDCRKEAAAKGREKAHRLVSSGCCVECEELLPEGCPYRCPPCRQKHSARSQQDYQRVKAEVYRAYGNKCKCCDEDREPFLQVDHIYGGGNKHRESMRPGNLHFWLKKEGFPDTFRLLCANCNFARGIHGYCPHTLPRPSVLISEADYAYE